MARSKRIKETAAGVAFYYVTSRANNRQFLFSSPKTKDALVDALKRAAAFSGVEIEAYAIMDNHVHAVVGVTRPECSISAMGPVPNGDAPQVGPVPNASCTNDMSETGGNVVCSCETADFAAPPTGPVPSGGGAAAGSVPRGWWMRRVAQIGAGKVFGSAEFVMKKASGLGHLFPAKRVVARAVGEIGFATHGWKLAKADEARRSRVVA